MTADSASTGAEPLDDLVAHAHEAHVVVIGGGIAGLVAALEFAKVGMPVTLVEASRRLGGTIASADVDGLRVDLGVTCWSTRGGTVRALVDDLGLGELVVTARADGTWIAGLPKGAAPAPSDAVLGIPANPWDDSVRRIIGWGGTWRAYLDRLRPPLTIGKQHNLGRLVRSRMGTAVHDRLVAPLTVGGFGVTPDEIDVVAAAPGLTTALTRTGSLGGAVADLLVDRGDGPAIESLDGGMRQLVDALTARLELLGARIACGTRVVGVARDGARWRVDTEATQDTGPASIGEEPMVDASTAASALTGSIVIVATGRDEALRLLAQGTTGARAAGEQDRWPVVLREVVTLVVDDPRLDAFPRGAQVFPVPGTSRASGLVHHTARWEWLARAAGPGRHVLTLAFDSPGVRPTGAEGAVAGAAPTRDAATPAAPGPDPAHLFAEAEAFEAARAEASTLLGVELDQRSIRAGHRAAFELAPPASLLGHADATSAVRQGLAPGIAAVGAWLSGSGLAQVVADARSEADRVRRSALWGGAAPS